MKTKGLNQADKVQRRVMTTGRVKAALIWELPPNKQLI
jgi:hypothetical protein